MKADICVLVLTYNHAKFIRQCLDSLLSQHLMPSKIIVADDHSGDGAWDIITEYAEAYPDLFCVYRHGENVGVFSNVRFLWEKASGEYVSLVEGDDYWHPQKLLFEYQALQDDTNAKIAYSNVEMVSEFGERLEVWHGKGDGPMPSGNLFFHVGARKVFSRSGNCFRNYLLHHSCLAEKTLYPDPDLPSLWDYDGHLTFSSKFMFAASATTDPLVFYRSHGAGISRDRRNVSVASELVYAKHSPQFSTLPAAQEAVVRLRQEARIALIHRQFLSAVKRDYYSPLNVYKRCVASLERVSSEEILVVWNQISPLLRNIVISHLAECVGAGRVRDGIDFLSQYINLEPDPLGMFLSLPPQIIEAFRCSQAS